MHLTGTTHVLTRAAKSIIQPLQSRLNRVCLARQIGQQGISKECLNDIRRSTVLRPVFKLRSERHTQVLNRRVEKGTVERGRHIRHRMGAYRSNSAFIEKNKAVHPRERSEAMRNDDDRLMCTEIRNGFEYIALGRNLESRGRFVDNKRCRPSQE
jgi:hypothetical protein